MEEPLPTDQTANGIVMTGVEGHLSVAKLMGTTTGERADLGA